MRTGLGQTHRLDQTVRIDPRVVLGSQLLKMSQAELEQAIEAELTENPALERIQDDDEPMSDSAILESIAPQEFKFQDEDAEMMRSLPQDEGTLDWMDLATSVPLLTDYVRAQLLPMLPAELRSVGAYIVECLNDNGYLLEPVEELALAMNCSIEQVELVVEKLKTCEPYGIGASGVQECLLLQLRGVKTHSGKLAQQIIKTHLEEFMGRKTMRIARRFGVMPDVVEEAFDLILTLDPFPGPQFAGRGNSRGRSASVKPDLVIERSEAGWTIEVSGPSSLSLAVSRAYQSRFSKLQTSVRADKDEKRHISVYIDRASTFLECLEQRKRTLRRIGEYLVQHQPGYVATGNFSFLLPLTRSQMAKDLGVHESTISRATADKFVQIANGEVISFDVFFKPALRVQKMIEDILASENPSNPMSDERIADLLAEQGVTIARRTVNKYRDKTRLLSSRKRRSA